MFALQKLVVSPQHCVVYVVSRQKAVCSWRRLICFVSLLISRPVSVLAESKLEYCSVLVYVSAMYLVK